MVDHNKPFYSSWGAMIRSHYLEAPMWAHCPCGAFRSRGVCFKGDGVKAAKTSGMKLLSPAFACEIQGMINRHSLVEWDGMAAWELESRLLSVGSNSTYVSEILRELPQSCRDCWSPFCSFPDSTSTSRFSKTP